MFGAVQELEPFLIPFGKTAIPVNLIGHPSLIDGKVCTIWSDFEKFIGTLSSLLLIGKWFYVFFFQIGYAQCYVCGATATEMSEPRGVLHWFIPKPGTLALGLHPLHIEMTGFNWFCKTAFHQDFRDWACRGIDDDIISAKKM